MLSNGKTKIVNLLIILLLVVSSVYLVNNYMSYSSYFNETGKVLGVYGLTSVAILGIMILLILVLYFKIHAFIALIIGSIMVGIGTGMDFKSIIMAIQNGMGSTLGSVATIVGLGAIFGEMLEASGGAQALSKKLIQTFGKEKASWALMLTGFLVAIPVFFDVGFIILIPLVYSLAKESKKSVIYYGIPLLAGLAVTHTFIPPTPGPVAVAAIIGADLGWVIFLGAIVGLPTAIISGPVWGSIIGKKIYVNPEDFIEENEEKVEKIPSFKKVITVIAVPLVMILLNTVLTTLVGSGIIEKSIVTDFIEFLGNPFVALTISTLIAFYVLGIKEGFSKEMILNLSNKAFGPIGLVILVTGAGGIFKQILVDSGIGTLLANTMANSNLPIIVLAFLVAGIVRVSQGSATVAMITAAGIVAPILDVVQVSAPGKALLVISIASGATILSHVNDSGFWLVGRYFGLDVKDTFRSWTVMETLVGGCGFIFSLILSFIL
ncbi:GntP family permease [Fusobacterium sp.]|uniref:GntP family permease n=1 Tax=Fusobacterium sp. TaxID=68766 RepID=UPI0025C004CF|nr:gluconate:H+ symporter [Fusobacterium sp.]